MESMLVFLGGLIGVLNGFVARVRGTWWITMVDALVVA